MTIEITGYSVSEGLVVIEAVNCSEEHMMRLEREDHGFEQEVMFMFDTTIPKDLQYLRRWLKNQKATRESKTWGEALRAVRGTITDISGKYRSWDY